MSAEIIALLACFFFSLQTVFARIGLRSTSSTAAVILTSAVACAGLWAAVFLFGQMKLPGPAALGYLALGGIMSPALSWILFYEGIIRVGMARAAPLSDIAPFVAALGGVLFFDEQVTLVIGIGMFAILVGVLLITFEREERVFRRRDLALPLLSSLSFGASMIFRKAALDRGALPLFGAAIGTTVGLACLLLISRLRPSLRSLRTASEDTPYLILAGLAITFAYGLYFSALKIGTLVTVAPIININPLFTLLIGVIFLRQYERFTVTVIIGTLITISGVALLTVL